MESSQSIFFGQPQTAAFSNTNMDIDPELTSIQKIWQANFPSTLTDATTLSNEVWHYIVSFFDDKTLLVFTRVCKQSRELVALQPAEKRVFVLAKAAAYKLSQDCDLADYAFIMIALTEALLNKRAQAETTADAIKGEYFQEQAYYLIDEILLIDRLNHCNCDHIHSLRNEFSDQYDDYLHDELSLLQIKRLCKEKRFDEAKELLTDVENLALGLFGMDSISLARAQNGQFKEALEIYDLDTNFIPEKTKIKKLTRESINKLFLFCAKSGQAIEQILPLFKQDHETISETLTQLEQLFYLHDLLYAMSLFAKTEMDNNRLENATLLTDLSREFAKKTGNGDLVHLLAKQQSSVGLKIEAIATLKQAKQLLKMNGAALAILESYLGLKEDAEVTLNQAKELVKDVNSAEIHDQIAEAERYLGKNEEAKKTFERAKKIAEEKTDFSSFLYKLKKGWISDVYETANNLFIDQKRDYQMKQIVEYLIKCDRLDEAKEFLKKGSFSDLKWARIIASLAKKEHVKGDLNLALETLSLITIPVYKILALLSLISPKNPFDFDFSEDFEKRIEGLTKDLDDDGIDLDTVSQINAIKRNLAEGISISRASS